MQINSNKQPTIQEIQLENRGLNNVIRYLQDLIGKLHVDLAIIQTNRDILQRQVDEFNRKDESQPKSQTESAIQ